MIFLLKDETESTTQHLPDTVAEEQVRMIQPHSAFISLEIHYDQTCMFNLACFSSSNIERGRWVAAG